MFALALILVELLTGQAALQGDDTVQLMMASLNPAERPTPAKRGVAVPQLVEQVLTRALAVQPRDRFHSAAEFRDALRAAMQAPTTLMQAQPALFQTPMAPGTKAGTALAPDPVAFSHTASPHAVLAPTARSTPRRKRSVPSVLATGAVVTVLGASLVAGALWSLSSWQATSTVVRAASEDAPPPIAEREVASGTTSAGAWLPSFRLRRTDGDANLTWLEGHNACVRHGMELCTEPQWELACEQDPAVGRVASWTAKADGPRGFVVRGSSSCAARLSVAGFERASQRVALCCSRAVAIVTPTSTGRFCKQLRPSSSSLKRLSISTIRRQRRECLTTSCSFIR